MRNSSLSVNDLKSIFEPEMMNADEAFAFACELNSAVQESLKECVAQEKEKLPPVTTTGNSQSAGANGSQNSTGTSTVASGDSNATPAATVPTPASETSFTEILASLLEHLRSYISCAKSSIE